MTVWGEVGSRIAQDDNFLSPGWEKFRGRIAQDDNFLSPGWEKFRGRFAQDDNFFFLFTNLGGVDQGGEFGFGGEVEFDPAFEGQSVDGQAFAPNAEAQAQKEIGRASCRERV